MANSNLSEQPVRQSDGLVPWRPWQSNPVFEFFASLKLAVVVLAVLIIAAIIGTFYESSFDANVARAYVYGAPWFNLWLILLGANLAVSAISRWPWRKYHVAFLITHLGIITLLTGSLIGRIWGTEGTITLLKGELPTNRLLVNQHQLRVHDTDGIVKGYAAEFLHHPPHPDHPKTLGALAGGARLSIIDYAAAVEGKLNPRPLSSGGAPKVGRIGAKVRLLAQEKGNKGRVAILLNGKEASFDVSENLGREVAIDGTPFMLEIDNYWADFRIQNGKPASLTEQPNNPA